MTKAPGFSFLSRSIAGTVTVWLEADSLYTDTLSAHPHRVLPEKSHNLLSPEVLAPVYFLQVLLTS